MILAVKYVPAMYATVWALVPPVVAIVLALITKEVYSSLFVGIVIGGLFYGYVFQDTDFSKWVEAVGYSLTQHPDTDLEKVADAAIDIVCAAQQEDGYLDT